MNTANNTEAAGENAPQVYSLEGVESITHIARDRIVLYREYGWISPLKSSHGDELHFDDEAIHRLRRIAFLIDEYGLDDHGMQLITALLNEVDRLRDEVRFLRR